jgi:2-hydroxycyclohexanecarboxyl-CoA dehydrogenase
MERLNERVALVTGAASGIGAATARRLSDEGALVIVADIDDERAGKLAAELGGVAVHMDVRLVESVNDAVEEGEDALGPIDILVNNAGLDRFNFFVDTTPEDWDRVIGVNLRGTLACTHAVLPGMLRRRRGSIINVSSEAGRVGTVAGSVYAATKAGIIGFTLSIAREAARYGVRCNAIAPGPTETPLLIESAAAAGPLGDRMRQAMIDSTMIGRLGRPEEIAAGIAYLASDDASFVTGTTLAVSGGIA